MLPLLETAQRQAPPDLAHSVGDVLGGVELGTAVAVHQPRRPENLRRMPGGHEHWQVRFELDREADGPVAFEEDAMQHPEMPVVVEVAQDWSQVVEEMAPAALVEVEDAPLQPCPVLTVWQLPRMKSWWTIP